MYDKADKLLGYRATNYCGTTFYDLGSNLIGGCKRLITVADPSCTFPLAEHGNNL